MQSGFLYNQLSDFKKKLLDEVADLFPKETDKFLVDNAKDFKKDVQKVAKQEVTAHAQHTRWDKKKQKDVSTNYHKNFKVGKKYSRGDARCVRVYNSARHAHLIENGHVLYSHGKSVGFVPGRFVIKIAETDFKSKFLDNTEKFLYQFFEKTTEQ